MATNEQKTVLVVDDEEEVVQFLSMALEDHGFNVLTASDGNQALQIIQQTPPDLISLDLVMPKSSGIKLVHELNKNPSWKKIPVLIVTGHARDDLGRADFDELTMSGPGVYLEKPVKPKEYVKAIRKILNMESFPSSQENSEKPLPDQIKPLLDQADPNTLLKIKEMLEEQKDES